MNEVQKKELETLIEILKIIKKHNLTYFAIGGTCLGAIRHKGFIPWDDDIDIAMPRKDYEKFRTEYYKELPDKYKKIDCDNVITHHFLFCKIHDSSTTQVEYYAEYAPDRYSGAFVDIMPVDGLPKGKIIQIIISEVLQILRRLNRISRPNNVPAKNPIQMFKNSIKNLFRKTHRYNFFSDIVKSLMSRFSYKDSENVIFTWRNKPPKGSSYKMVFPRYYFDEIIEVPFEYIKICVPAEYDQYLTDDFGNYMVLPPLEKQKSIHDVLISDMETPCAFYADLKRKEMAAKKG